MHHEHNPYSLLSGLPLFQGMSLSEFDNVIAHVRLGFSKVEAGSDIVKSGQPVSGLLFILSGEAEAENLSDDGAYSVREQLPLPCVLQPERLFGLTQRYVCRVRATSDCNLLLLEKGEVTRIANESQVFRLNMLNIICTQVQRMNRRPWRHQPEGIRRKIAAFVECRCMRPAGRKVVGIGMVRLAREIGESRLNVSRELHRMQADGLIELSREMIVVPRLERLLLGE